MERSNVQVALTRVYEPPEYSHLRLEMSEQLLVECCGATCLERAHAAWMMGIAQAARGLASA